MFDISTMPEVQSYSADTRKSSHKSHKRQHSINVKLENNGGRNNVDFVRNVSLGEHLGSLFDSVEALERGVAHS